MKKKREKKMELYRETLVRLNGRELAEARGGNTEGDTGRWTSCGQPNCCGEPVETQ